MWLEMKGEGMEQERFRQRQSLTDRLVDIREKLEHVHRHLLEFNHMLVTLRDNQTAMETRIMARLDDLEARVTNNGDLIQSGITLINGIAQELKDIKASGDIGRLDAVIAKLDSQDTSLAEAIVANTPADPAATG